MEIAFDRFMNLLNAVNEVLWADWVLFVLLGVGVLFTIWSGFSQFRALTHGAAVVRGKYDDKDDPGAINHFQALSTALSATVGLGNIAGVALAVQVGGPGAVFWMWVTGLIGMALKLTEVTQAMLYRDTEDPDNPRGGAMWVCKRGFAAIHPSLKWLGVVVGAVFCVPLLISAVTGGNMFQSWNVADISFAYFGVPQYATGVILTVAVGVVIIGGIRRIGDVASRVVPLMCGLYILASLYIIAVNLGEIPRMFALIFREAFSPSEAGGAFLGGVAGYGFLVGMQRALFSSEAGQGSAPIAHSAAKTDEPVREGVVAGLEPFIDTIVVCTITALVILLSGTWNRDPALRFAAEPPRFALVADEQGIPSPSRDGEHRFAAEPVPVVVADAEEARGQMRAGQKVFLVLDGGENATTGGSRHKLVGALEQGEGGSWLASFPEFTHPSPEPPSIAADGVYFDFNGATLTAKAFDTTLPGLGIWIVPAAVWLFAFSTIISWSYYGEQGAIYLFGTRSVVPYRVLYCLCVLLSCLPFINAGHIENISVLGTGVMLWANIPIMLIFGPIAMKAYHDYIRRLKSGELDRTAHKPAPLKDVIEGRDV